MTDAQSVDPERRILRTCRKMANVFQVCVSNPVILIKENSKESKK